MKNELMICEWIVNGQCTEDDIENCKHNKPHKKNYFCDICERNVECGQCIPVQIEQEEK